MEEGGEGKVIIREGHEIYDGKGGNGGKRGAKMVKERIGSDLL